MGRFSNLHQCTFKFCPDIFDHVEKRLDKKGKVDFKIFDVINWEKNNYNTQLPNI